MPAAPQQAISGACDEAPLTLLAWYDRHRRRLPWRAAPGRVAAPYRVWLSEIMLQQTSVVTATPYFEAFIARWPDIGSLAGAGLDEVLHAWQGLGYYARARNLHRCARVVESEHAGAFPATEQALRALPGIGAYTAAAIAAIAFGRRAVVIDGNVERVMARLNAVAEPLPGAKPLLRQHAGRLTPQARPGDYAQAVMDLGAMICTPRKPACGHCPWSGRCLARARGIQSELPKRAPKPARPWRYGVVFVATDGDGAVLLRRRAERGLLGGMMELPSTDWRTQPWSTGEAVGFAPVDAEWRQLAGAVRHIFTHFQLDFSVLAGDAGVARSTGLEGIWCPPNRLSEQALPSLMKKVLRHAHVHPT